MPMLTFSSANKVRFAKLMAGIVAGLAAPNFGKWIAGIACGVPDVAGGGSVSSI
jgi:hypothetical protein